MADAGGSREGNRVCVVRDMGVEKIGGMQEREVEVDMMPDDFEGDWERLGVWC